MYGLDANTVINLWDISDVDYLCHNLTIRQLRIEKEHAELKAKTADDGIDWDGFAAACQSAIDRVKVEIVKSNQAKPSSKVDIGGIKSKNDIVEVVGRYAPIRKSGRRFMALCPLHPDKKTPSMVVYPDQQTFHCFGCNQGGDVIAFIMAVEKTDFVGAIKILGA